jgi:ADP-ribose pyrophosphatase YjhB (NUDIX family)
MRDRNAHCVACGTAYTPDAPWPRTCIACGETRWLNPTPVGVMIVPVDDGVMLIRRGIEPRRGELALPGGFIVVGETWQQGAVRELREETDVVVAPEAVREFMVRSPDHGHVVLIFGVCDPLRGADLPPFSETDETVERLVVNGPVELAFPLHTEALARYFATRAG